MMTRALLGPEWSVNSGKSIKWFDIRGNISFLSCGPKSGNKLLTCYILCVLYIYIHLSYLFDQMTQNLLSPSHWGCTFLQTVIVWSRKKTLVCSVLSGTIGSLVGWLKFCSLFTVDWTGNQEKNRNAKRGNWIWQAENWLNINLKVCLVIILVSLWYSHCCQLCVRRVSF